MFLRYGVRGAFHARNWGQLSKAMALVRLQNFCRKCLARFSCAADFCRGMSLRRMESEFYDGFHGAESSCRDASKVRA